MNKKGYTGGQLQQQIIDLAHIFGWRVAHFRPAQTKYGWRTPVSADGKGFPDLILVRPPRIIVWECKSKGEKLSPEQEKWLDCFKGCLGLSASVVTYQDWDTIQKLLE